MILPTLRDKPLNKQKYYSQSLKQKQLAVDQQFSPEQLRLFYPETHLQLTQQYGQINTPQEIRLDNWSIKQLASYNKECPLEPFSVIRLMSLPSYCLLLTHHQQK